MAAREKYDKAYQAAWDELQKDLKATQDE